MFAVLGNSNMFQKSLAHGPAPITTCSQSIVPLSVSTPVTALLLLPLLKPVTFTWDYRDDSLNKGKKDVGFIAQDLQEVDDEYTKLVYDANPDKLEATYGRLIPILVKAVQDLSKKVKELENNK